MRSGTFPLTAACATLNRNMMRKGILFGLAMLLATGGGYWLGYRRALSAAAGAQASARAVMAKRSAAYKRSSAARPAAEKAAAQVVRSDAPRSAKELRARVSELKKAWLSSVTGDDSDWTKKVAEVEVAAIPQMLALADKELPKTMRLALRQQLLGRWAASDVSAALDYAQAPATTLMHDSRSCMPASAWA